MMKNGQLHGQWKWYRQDGSLMRAGQFKAGAQAGLWETFDREGRRVSSVRH
jgi:antitoxin component YwqK of YwqJK toxin-antitoxin module